MNLTSCSNDTPDYCYSMNAEKSKFDQCVCRCLLNYPMYRNPDVFTAGRGEFTSKGKPGCVWHSNHRYGKCFGDILSVDLWCRSIFTYLFHAFKSVCSD